MAAVGLSRSDGERIIRRTRLRDRSDLEILHPANIHFVRHPGRPHAWPVIAVLALVAPQARSSIP